MPKKPKKNKNGGISIDSLASSRPVGQVFTSGGKYYQSYPDPASPTGYTLKSWSSTEPETYTSINEPYSVREQQDNEDATNLARETGREQVRMNDSTIEERKARIRYQDAQLRQQGKDAEADRKLKRELAMLSAQMQALETGAKLSGPADPFSFSDYAQGLQTAGIVPRAFQNLANNQQGSAFAPLGAQPNPLNLNTLAQRLGGGTAGSVPAGTIPGGGQAAAAGAAGGNGFSDQDRINASYGALLPVAMNPQGVGSGVFESMDRNDQLAALDGFGKLGIDKGWWARTHARSHPTQGSPTAA